MITKEHVIGLVDDLVSDFLYYDRKDDEDCPLGAIEELIKTKGMTIEEIVEIFKYLLEENI